MLSTVYVEMAPGVRVEDLYDQMKTYYEVILVNVLSMHTLLSLGCSSTFFA